MMVLVLVAFVVVVAVVAFVMVVVAFVALVLAVVVVRHTRFRVVGAPVLRERIFSTDNTHTSMSVAVPMGE